MRRTLAALAAIALTACAPADPASPPASVAPPSGSADALPVPDVVGMEHQRAQDTLQAAGFFHLAEEDATGQGRLLVSDRNWVVVSQDPPAGAVVPASDRILLRSKKKTDP
ncbi:PASTA domain-containing protein [Actinokineospora fastidiosa]|uniref:PASTA domain-containing protein n=1 Tax=Actinokineospora fastidiosa TaxID=1816 RepID=A0A918G5U7_9PSEU|nr:PASTA domain-containing protein [Actinokineospora fastidiosa]GGS18102.1 hypothetical protein GCM10010171_08280 [Actinokineospora fastidiosa]